MCTLDRHIYLFNVFFPTENDAEKEWRNWPLSQLRMIAVPEFKFKHGGFLVGFSFGLRSLKPQQNPIKLDGIFDRFDVTISDKPIRGSNRDGGER